MTFKIPAPLVSLILLLGSILSSKAQSVQFTNFQMELSGQPLLKITLPFKDVRVFDKRFDTSKLGYLFSGPHYKNIVLKPSLSSAVEDYFRKNFVFATESDKILVVMLKTTWMHEMRSGEEDVEDFNNELQKLSKCIFKADVYSSENNSYQALVRVDTSLENKNPLVNVSSVLLLNSLNYTADKILSLDLNQLFTKKTKINETDVMNYYDQRLKKPRITNDLLQRGVYLTFDDFLNNRLTAYKFSLEQDEESDYMYIEENGGEKLFTDFWGFSDGENLYIKLGFNFFKLTKDNNTYSFWGCRRAVHITPSRNKNRVVRYMAFGNLANLRNAKLKNLLRPMQLDMESGKAY
jgi:hypothetical protein